MVALTVSRAFRLDIRLWQWFAAVAAADRSRRAVRARSDFPAAFAARCHLHVGGLAVTGRHTLAERPLLRWLPRLARRRNEWPRRGPRRPWRRRVTLGVIVGGPRCGRRRERGSDRSWNDCPPPSIGNDCLSLDWPRQGVVDVDDRDIGALATGVSHVTIGITLEVRRLRVVVPDSIHLQSTRVATRECDGVRAR
jgi:hypothetical protein